MITWYWIPITAFVSAAFGLLLASILAAAKEADECQECPARQTWIAWQRAQIQAILDEAQA